MSDRSKRKRRNRPRKRTKSKHELDLRSALGLTGDGHPPSGYAPRRVQGKLP